MTQPTYVAFEFSNQPNFDHHHQNQFHHHRQYPNTNIKNYHQLKTISTPTPQIQFRLLSISLNSFLDHMNIIQNWVWLDSTQHQSKSNLTPNTICLTPYLKFDIYLMRINYLMWGSTVHHPNLSQNWFNKLLIHIQKYDSIPNISRYLFVSNEWMWTLKHQGQTDFTDVKRMIQDKGISDKWISNWAQSDER